MYLRTCALLMIPVVGVASEDWVKSLGGSLTKDAGGAVIEVSLRAAWISDAELSRLAVFSKLRKLDLAYTHINDRALEPLQKLRQLTDLDLTFAEHITDAGLAHLRSISSLERLNLEGTRISDSGMSSLAALSNLVSLNLRSTLITDGAVEQLEILARLEELSIGANRFAGWGLVHLQALRRLRHLDLSGVQLTDDGIWSVALTDLNIGAIATLKNLESLNLAATELTGVAKIPDGGMRESNTIRITDLGIEKLGDLTNLKRLEIARARIGERGLRALARLPRLESLGLGYTQGLDESAAAVLAEMKHLSILDLSGVSLTELAKKRLAGNSGLRIVGFEQKGISTENHDR
jgi:Leucine-rich repeat (LRR) protein